MTSTSNTTAFSNNDHNYIWSDANNWSAGLPTSGSTVLAFGLSEDDIAGLSLAGLTVENGATVVNAFGVNLRVGSVNLVGGNNTTLAADGGTVTITGPVTDSGLINILLAQTPGSVLDDEASVDPGGIQYQAIQGGEVILAAQPALTSLLYFNNGSTFAFKNPGATIATSMQGLAPGDAIELPGTKAVRVGAAGSDLKITTNQGTFDFTSVSYTSKITGYTDNGVDALTGLDKITFTTGSNIVACYCRGTLIATRTGEVEVEALAIGDEVITGAGMLRPIKWIGRRSYGGHFLLGQRHLLPICIKAGAIEDNVPRRDLWISPHHAMVLDGLLIEARDIVNGFSIVQAEQVDRVEYFHIELDSHDILIAEGALSESYADDDSRGMFHNAHEYCAPYPDAAQGPVRYCAPRLDIGYEVEAIRRKLAHRAGLMTADQDAGGLRGYIDAVSPRYIDGWAQNVDHPDAPVCLDIWAGGKLIGQTLANRYREDLERAGLGSGCHSFSFIAPDGLILVPGTIELRRSLDGAPLALAAIHRAREVA